jgi:hypothetical protein
MIRGDSASTGDLAMVVSRLTLPSGIEPWGVRCAGVNAWNSLDAGEPELLGRLIDGYVDEKSDDVLPR